MATITEQQAEELLNTNRVLREQNHHIVEALRAVVENRMTGPGSAAAWINALNPELEVKPVGPFVVGE